MRCFATGIVILAVAGCSSRGADTRTHEATVAPTAVAFDGADYDNDSAKIAHGKRIATLFACGPATSQWPSRR